MSEMFGEGRVLPFEGVRPTFRGDNFVAAGAVVIGDVVVGEQTSIWFNTVVRGDVHSIRIGARTNIQDLCMCHVTGGAFPLHVGDDVTVGHRVVLHGCTVGDRSLIGMGSVVLDGASIADDVLVAAGSLVTQGAQFPSGVLVMGTPARVKRPLTDEELADLPATAAHYVMQAQRYR